jgi:hypothetical protein
VSAVPHEVLVEREFDAEALVEHTLVHVAGDEGESSLSYKQRK